MDAFYVSVELDRRPELRGRPVVVGGTGPRGVVAAASYEARAYGVRSAQPSSVARRRCPDAVFLPGDHALYGKVSERVMAIFRQVTPLVEPLSLDEAFLDVTGAQRRAGAPHDIAVALRAVVAEQERLACSVGVAPSKFLAKLASEAAKPSPSPHGPVPGRGVVVVPPGGELAFLHPLPLRALWGVGPATLARLERLGLATVGDLAGIPEEAVIAAVGDATGRHLAALARAHDERPVQPDRAPKSIGHEETFPTDLTDRDLCERELVRLCDAVAARLRRTGMVGRTLSLKVRFAGFVTVTRAHTLPVPTNSAPVLLAEAKRLLAAIDVANGIRLLGVSMSGLGEGGGPEQLALDLPAPGGDARAAAGGAPGEGWNEAERAIDAIRARFGHTAIGPAALSRGGRVRPLEPDRPVWGPDETENSPEVGGGAPPDTASSR
jgi:DNA polymerase-4